MRKNLVYVVALALTLAACGPKKTESTAEAVDTSRSVRCGLTSVIDFWAINVRNYVH